MLRTPWPGISLNVCRDSFGEDPFDPERNCGASLSREAGSGSLICTASKTSLRCQGLQRLKEELARAQLILSAKEEAVVLMNVRSCNRNGGIACVVLWHRLLCPKCFNLGQPSELSAQRAQLPLQRLTETLRRLLKDMQLWRQRTWKCTGNGLYILTESTCICYSCEDILTSVS